MSKTEYNHVTTFKNVFVQGENSVLDIILSSWEKGILCFYSNHRKLKSSLLRGNSSFVYFSIKEKVSHETMEE